MNKLNNFLLKLRIMKDTRGQDLIEYALMAGFVAVAAGAIVPSVAMNISTIFSKVNSVVGGAAAQGGS
jgi:pilus assembly protein Flp/PilA